MSRLINIIQSRTKHLTRTQVTYIGGIFLMILLLLPHVATHAALTLRGNVKFSGNLVVGGAISKGSGTFVIDHPLDPANKLLFHSFVESPDVKNIYDGITVIDENGEATVTLPDYFDVLNRDFRYQIKGVTVAQPNLHLKKDVIDGKFIIAGGIPGAEVSWQVSGIRKDPFIVANPIIPEVEKGPEALVDKGEYLFPGYEEVTASSSE